MADSATEKLPVVPLAEVGRGDGGGGSGCGGGVRRVHFDLVLGATVLLLVHRSLPVEPGNTGGAAADATRIENSWCDFVWQVRSVTRDIFAGCA